MTKYMDYTADSAQFSFDLNKSLLFKLNDQNLINVLGVQHLNTLENASLVNGFRMVTLASPDMQYTSSDAF